MPKHVSPKPASFRSRKERDYWHMAQDIAFAAGEAIVEREGKSWLITDNGEQLLCEPIDSARLWYESWLQMQERYPAMARTWVGESRRLPVNRRKG